MSDEIYYSDLTEDEKLLLHLRHTNLMATLGAQQACAAVSFFGGIALFIIVIVLLFVSGVF